MADSIATHEGAFPAREERVFDLRGSLTEAGGGAAAVVLAILGLVHVAPPMLVSIATIVVGGCFLILGGVVAARFAAATTTAQGEARKEVVGESLTMESLCGAAGIILGILALVGADPAVLVPVAAIVFGCGLLAASGTAARLSALSATSGEYSGTLPVVLGPGFLIGLGGIILGILALAGVHAVILSLVAMLAFGTAFMLTASSFSSVA